MPDARWCCACQRVSAPDPSIPTDPLMCPHCGADGSNLQAWSGMLVRNPHWPEHPRLGKAYRIRKLKDAELN